MANANTSYPFPSNLNVANFVTIKYNKNNFLLWETQIVSLIESQDLVGFLTGETAAPAETIPGANGESCHSKSGFLILVAIRKPVSEVNKVFWLLEGLVDKYESFKIPTLRPPIPNYDDAVSQLKGYELRNKYLLRATPSHSVVFAAQALGDFRNSNRGQAAVPNMSPSPGLISAGSSTATSIDNLHSSDSAVPTGLPPPQLPPEVLVNAETTLSAPPAVPHGSCSQASPLSMHPMITRAKAGITKPNPNLVVKPAPMLIVLTLADVWNWPVQQLDVKNAFLHGDLDVPVYMEQPPGFRDDARPGHVCLLRRALYGLKQAPETWFERFSDFLTQYGFLCISADSSLFVFHQEHHIKVLLLYVDDIVVTGDSASLLADLIIALGHAFSMKDLGPLHCFLGVECKAIATPIALKQPLTKSDDQAYPDPSYCQRIVGALQYLILTRPDISYSVNVVCPQIHFPTMADFLRVKSILRYIRGSLDFGLRILSTSGLNLHAFADADWVGCKETRRSTTGLCAFVGANRVSWGTKKQQTVARSTAEAEPSTCCCCR
ncbi:hypothetical protein CRG98_028322 [Punica granatum]|uniref:Reverse transcriptase Ty1/copia-type domain-containing protein n=1 Tax=Punica granatum TaxID=22663 RepID=A0A2I0J5F6_PUNGR|nr:hypothetical protein CRG98_028322 [Punica granatum]